MTSTRSNIRLYPLYRMSTAVQAWIPVFFLYFSQYVAFADVILLSSIYYVSVVALELPSGYFSDRFGRRPTLILSALSLVGAYLLFLLSHSFSTLAIAQILLASGIAFNSGTDTAFHYDSLCDAGLADEYAGREARAEKLGLAALALSTLAGGLAASIDLRLAYVLSLLGALATLVLAWRFVEPGHTATEIDASFARTLSRCIARLRHPLLAWLFAYFVLIFAVAHTPFEFFQPYVALLGEGFSNRTTLTPIATGIVISISMFGGSLGASLSIRWLRRLGLRRLLLLALALQLMIVGGMAAILSPVILALIFLRNFPMSLIHSPLNTAILPLLQRQERATYLSLQSLAARLGFASLLYALSSVSSVGEIHWESLSLVLQMGLGIGSIGAVILAASAGVVERKSPQ